MVTLTSIHFTDVMSVKPRPPNPNLRFPIFRPVRKIISYVEMVLKDCHPQSTGVPGGAIIFLNFFKFVFEGQKRLYIIRKLDISPFICHVYDKEWILPRILPIPSVSVSDCLSGKKKERGPDEN